jgi:hypothetical protein
MSCGSSTIDRRLKCSVVACAAIGILMAHGQVTVRAHHTAMNLSVPVPGCGWAEGDSLRDRSNLSESRSRRRRRWSRRCATTVVPRLHCCMTG